MELLTIVAFLAPAAIALAWALGLWIGHRKGRKLNEIEPKETAREALTLSGDEAEMPPLAPEDCKRRWPELNNRDNGNDKS